MLFLGGRWPSGEHKGRDREREREGERETEMQREDEKATVGIQGNSEKKIGRKIEANIKREAETCKNKGKRQRNPGLS